MFEYAAWAGFVWPRDFQTRLLYVLHLECVRVCVCGLSQCVNIAQLSPQHGYPKTETPKSRTRTLNDFQSNSKAAQEG